MVTRQREPRHAGLDAKLEFRYTAVGKVYERKPLKRTPSKKNMVKEYHAKHPLVPPVHVPDSQKWAGAQGTGVPTPKPEPVYVPIKEQSVRELVEGMTIKTAHEAYVILHGIFNYPAK
jgi:hypothetical protein